MRLTAHFDSSEFDVHEPWPAHKLAERQALALLAEDFRALFGNRPARITSAYRSPERNESVSGASRSEHMDARALDLTFVGITDASAVRTLLDARDAGTLPDCGQVIVYDDTTHIHISLKRYDGRQNRQLLWAYRENGLRRYRPLTRELLRELEARTRGKSARRRS